MISERPGPPGRPDVVPPPTDEYLLAQMQPDVITVRWKPPENDGGTPITGKYLLLLLYVTVKARS